MSEATITEMIAALGLEVQAIRRPGKSSSIEILGGERYGRAEGNVLISFPLAENNFLRDDSPIRIDIGKEEADAMVVSLGEGVITLALEKDLGDGIPSARLISDDSFLVERLKPIWAR